MRLVDQLKFGFSARLAALYMALFMLGGIQLPFFPVWLKAKGLDAGMIGLVLAAPMVMRVFAITVATRKADRRDALRAAIIVASCAGVLGYAAVGLASGGIAILLTFALASLATTPVMPLTETYALKGLSARGRAYGPVRLWGSLAFIAGSFIAGFAADAFAARHLIWLIVAASAIGAVAAFMLAPLSSATPATGQAAPPRISLLRDPAFIAVVAAASLIQASHAVYYGFSALEWRGAGFDGTTIAALWGLGVIAEVVLFAFSGRLPLFFQPPVLLMIGALGGLLRWGAMAFDPPALWLPGLQILHAATFGASHLGAMGFVARHAPPGQAATAQGYLAIALGLVMAAATGLSGVLYGAFGSRAYAAMALAAVAGGACAFVAYRARGEPAL
jgi:MFS transporter, PPP family, 3-phenylpropionic acid transporter